MTVLWGKVQFFANEKPNVLAIIGEFRNYTWDELQSAVITVAKQLESTASRTVALFADNSPAWIIIDLACQLAKITLLPLPNFFSQQQLLYAIKQAGATAIIHQKDNSILRMFNEVINDSNTPVISLNLVISQTNQQPARLPENTNKITFTSGSTGNPKGVCLSNKQQTVVAESLLNAIEIDAAKHLCILPFSTLLENIGGIYAPLISGGTVIAVSQSVLGFNGSNGFQLRKLLDAITDYQPDSMILLPELLLALVGAVSRGWQPPKSLQFIAVGGSKVSPILLQQAHDLDLPVYEGYGLSECSSVVSLNTLRNNKIGSTGKVLEHINVSIEEDEIIVSGNTFLGYIEDPESWSKPIVHTGDLGFIDEQNFLHINGRKTNVLISSFGRNINPEWVESELLSGDLLQQAIVFGDAKPYCIALVWPRNKNTTSDEIQSWIDQINQPLPDYAQITDWSLLSEPLSVETGLTTSNSRPIRDTIYQQYQAIIEQLY